MGSRSTARRVSLYLLIVWEFCCRGASRTFSPLHIILNHPPAMSETSLACERQNQEQRGGWLSVVQRELWQQHKHRRRKG